MPSYTDTHCHLNYTWFDEDLDDILQRACEARVGRILIPGFDLDACKRAVQLSETYETLYAAVGIHPNDSMTWNDQTRKELDYLARHPKVLAIGEIGLDYYRDRAPMELQQTILREQLELAAIHGKPVIIHNRQAENDLYPLLFDWQEELQKNGVALADKPGILHAFAENSEAAREMIEHNFYIGVGGVVTFPKALQVQETVRSLSLQSILLETDSPFLTPQAHRGQRNEPAYIPLIAEKIASLLNLPEEEVAAITTRNAENLFHWGLPE